MPTKDSRYMAVIDTNILFGGAFPKKSNPRKIVQALFENKFIPIVSEKTYLEMTRTLSILGKGNLKRVPTTSPDEILQHLKSHGHWVMDKKPEGPICKDPEDDKFFVAAAQGKADYLVSNDRLVLEVKEYKGVQVISAADFVKLLEETE